MADIESKKFYFVDEAGDGALFNRKGKVIIGKEGCSNYFFLGVVDIKDHAKVSTELIELRKRLLADPYFKNVPSLQKEEKKTYYLFHAKDDLPEVRREVFSIILQNEIKFLAVVRNKWKVLEYVVSRNNNDPKYHYDQNELYDYMVRQLFKNILHKNDEYDITFARRGQSDRTESLKKALIAAQRKFEEKWKISNHSMVNVIPDSPIQCLSLQVVDYFLWALQRFYERQEDRYLEYLWPKFKMVHDLDDKRKANYGCFYDKKRPLTKAIFDDCTPGI